jgi:hypothetical protein
MGFMQASGSADFDIYLKYNGKAGRWYTKQDGGEEYEVANMTGIFDMDSLKTGWFLYASGQAPQKEYDPSLGQAASNPGEGYKRGFELRVFSDKNFGGVREFGSTANVAIEAMNELYDAWQAQKANNGGKLPVVSCSGVAPITGKHGTNYKPALAIVGWADRPAELSAMPKAATEMPKADVASGAKHMPPPAPVAASSEPDF